MILSRLFSSSLIHESHNEPLCESHVLYVPLLEITEPVIIANTNDILMVRDGLLAHPSIDSQAMIVEPVGCRSTRNLICCI